MTKGDTRQRLVAHAESTEDVTLLLLVAALVATEAGAVAATVGTGVVVATVAAVVVGGGSGGGTELDGDGLGGEGTGSRDLAVGLGDHLGGGLGLSGSGVLVGGDSVVEVLLVDGDLSENGLDVGLGGDGLSVVGLGGLVGLLDGEAATEGTGLGVVAAADSADVAGGGC